MRFAIFPNINKPQTLLVAREIINFLRARGVDVVTEKDKTEQLKIPALDDIAPNSIDLLISLGGDGTILRILHHHPELSSPILGVNLGSLGFMADVPIQEINQALEDVIAGQYRVEERVMLEAVTTKGERCLCVNEVVIHRVQNPCLIDIGIHVGESYLNTFSADGLIISTPNGSTAYSLAAGGPILTPDLNVFVITPICPHTISNRPIVIGSKSEIRVKYLSEYSTIQVTYDGFPMHTLAPGEEIKIFASSKKFRLVSFAHHDFFSTLRTKLGWSGRLKNS